MSSERETFLRVTFGGGRFAAHVLPVEVLVEFATLQQIVLKAARLEFRRRYPNRVRLPRGFSEAGRLDLSATEDNCFTATLTCSASASLPDLDPSTFDVFVEARNAVLSAFRELHQGNKPTLVDHDLLALFVRLGDRLEGDEWIDLRERRDTESVRIDQATRASLAKLLRQPVEQVADLDGEVEEIDDRGSAFTLKTRSRQTVNVPFLRTQREDILSAMQKRPALRVRVRGRVLWGAPPRVTTVEEFEVVDHERKPDIDKLWERITVLQGVPEGWLGEETRAPHAEVIARAREVLAQLLADHPEISRPKVFPTPEGGLQAEWVFDRVAADVRFSVEAGVLYASAVWADGDRENERLFNAVEVSRDDASMLAAWLREARAMQETKDAREARS